MWNCLWAVWLRRNRGPCQPQEYATFLLLLLGGEVEWIKKAQQVFFPRHPSWKRQFKFCHTPSLPCQDNRALQSKADWSLLQHQPASLLLFNRYLFKLLRSWISGGFQKSLQELRMLFRSLSDCQLLTLNVMISVFVRNSRLCHLFIKSPPLHCLCLCLPVGQLSERSHVSKKALQCSKDTEIKSQLMTDWLTDSVTRSPIKLPWTSPGRKIPK